MDNEKNLFVADIAIDDYESFRAILKDEIPGTYDGWLQNMKEKMDFYNQQGKVLCVRIKPREFMAYCLSENSPADLNSLSKLAKKIGST